jgi:hypothetical protein
MMPLFLRSAQLIARLAGWLSEVKVEGISQEMYESFAGLSTKFISFRSDEPDRAKRWLSGWLSENARGYLKVVDPYFDIEQFDYFMHVPAGCIVLVVCTAEHLKPGDGQEQLKNEILRYWRQKTPQVMPRIQLLIVPKSNEDKFHDRAIATTGACLSLGQSLNRLGRSRGNITVLRDEDAAELERSYVDSMLNNAAWFVAGVCPTILFLGG